jgi:hypothetical protein
VIHFVKDLLETYNKAFRPVMFTFETTDPERSDMMTYRLKAVSIPTKVAELAASASSAASAASAAEPAVSDDESAASADESAAGSAASF